MNSNNCSGNNLIALASSLAVVIGNEYDTNELSILAAFSLLLETILHFSLLPDN